MTLTYEELVRLFGQVLNGPPEDGDICIPQVAADHLEAHGVPPGDFFREGVNTLNDRDPKKFSFGMSHRIRPIIRPGYWNETAAYFAHKRSSTSTSKRCESD